MSVFTGLKKKRRKKNVYEQWDAFPLSPLPTAGPPPTQAV